VLDFLSSQAVHDAKYHQKKDTTLEEGNLRNHFKREIRKSPLERGIKNNHTQEKSI
jgi:hypothetical protein